MAVALVEGALLFAELIGEAGMEMLGAESIMGGVESFSTLMEGNITMANIAEAAPSIGGGIRSISRNIATVKSVHDMFTQASSYFSSDTTQQSNAARNVHKRHMDIVNVDRSVRHKGPDGGVTTAVDGESKEVAEPVHCMMPSGLNMIGTQQQPYADTLTDSLNYWVGESNTSMWHDSKIDDGAYYVNQATNGILQNSQSILHPDLLHAIDLDSQEAASLNVAIGNIGSAITTKGGYLKP